MDLLHLEHFLAVAVLQDHPASTDVHMSAALIARIVNAVPSVRCVKEGSDGFNTGFACPGAGHCSARDASAIRVRRLLSRSRPCWTLCSLARCQVSISRDRLRWSRF
jgi:hypothetical protein